MLNVEYYWCWEWPDRIEEFKSKGWKETNFKQDNSYRLIADYYKGRLVPEKLVCLARLL